MSEATNTPYEFVMEHNRNITFTGSSLQEVFDKIVKEYKLPGDTLLEQVAEFLALWRLENQIPDSTKRNFLDEVFMLMQDKLVGTWKWYGDLYNEVHWHYCMNPETNKTELHRYKVTGHMVQDKKIKLAEQREQKRILRAQREEEKKRVMAERREQKRILRAQREEEKKRAMAKRRKKKARKAKRLRQLLLKEKSQQILQEYKKEPEVTPANEVSTIKSINKTTKKITTREIRLIREKSKRFMPPDKRTSPNKQSEKKPLNKSSLTPHAIKHEKSKRFIPTKI